MVWGNPEGTVRIHGPVTTDPKGEVRFGEANNTPALAPF